MRIQCPAKVNLFLSVTGPREDGFHDLVSVVTPIEAADELEVELLAPGAPWAWRCNVPGLPEGRDNLVGKAAALYQARIGATEGLAIRLEKRIPSEAGLGGGSSDAAGMLLALQSLYGNPLGQDELEVLAAAVGSDCPLFLQGEAVVMRGRGERIERLPTQVLQRLDGIELTVFKPQFGIPTGWAFGHLREKQAYLGAEASEARLAEWLGNSEDLEELFYNSFEHVVTEKYVAMDAMLSTLREQYGIACLMSGSGSACFALAGAGHEKHELIRDFVVDAWGQDAICFSTRIAAFREGHNSAF